MTRAEQMKALASRAIAYEEAASASESTIAEAFRRAARELREEESRMRADQAYELPAKVAKQLE